METEQLFATLSENESIIRTYRCAKLRRLFVKPSIGYLTITNKRLVYHSEEKAIGNDSAIISEIPLQDVGGISSVIDNSFNLLYFLLACAALYIGTILLTTLLPQSLTGWGVSIVLTVPFLISLLFQKRIISPDVAEKIIQNMEGTSVESLFNEKTSEILVKVFRIMFFVGMPIFAWNLSQEVPVFGFVVLLAIYFLMYMLIVGKMPAFGLEISSRTGSGTGIVIHGNSYLALFNKSNTAAKTVSAAPSDEAETVAKELGALVMDIQQMGDLGIEKWTRR